MRKFFLNAILATGLLFPAINLFAQQPLKINDTIPNWHFLNVLNATSSSIHLTDYKGKLLILDFWSPNCLACIRGFNEMEKLQHEFRDSIQIILVSRITKEETESFFAKRKNLTMPSLPFITGDTILHKAFPHVGEPMHVWISKDGKVQFITEGFETTASNIRSVLNGKTTLLVTKSDKKKSILSLVNPQYNDEIDFYSCLSKCNRSITIGSGIPPGKIHLNYNCLSVEELYLQAYSEGSKYDYERPGRHELKVPDGFNYHRPENRDSFANWYLNHAYTYQLLVQNEADVNPYEWMQQDLKRYFKIHVKKVIKERLCWVLIRTGEVKVHSKGGTPLFNFYRSNYNTITHDSVRIIRNEPFSYFSSYLQYIAEDVFHYPYLNETNLSGNIDISMNGKSIDCNDLNDLRPELHRYNLDLVLEKRKLVVLELYK